jgi:hypothetical protein
MSFGIGLGAFVDGIEQGQRIRQNFDAQKEQRANKAELAGIETDTKASYESAVQSGDQPANSYEKFWIEHALPMRKNALLRQGDVAGAKALDEWGQSDAALTGGKLFGSAMLKAQTGDAGGAIDDAIKAAKTKGYMSDHGYELVSKNEVLNPDGTLKGYRLMIKTESGETIKQDVPPDKIAQLVATFANPDVAWQSQVAAREKAAKEQADKTEAENKRAVGLQDYEDKKKIDRQYDKPPAPTKDTAAKDYMAAKKTRMELDTDFASKSPEEQDAQIRADLAGGQKYANDAAAPATDAAAPAIQQPAGIGAAAPPAAGPRIRVDTATGLPAPEAAAPGIAAPVPGDKNAVLLDEAVTQMTKGGDPRKIREALAAQGIGPDELTGALKARAKRFAPPLPTSGVWR